MTTYVRLGYHSYSEGKPHSVWVDSAGNNRWIYDTESMCLASEVVTELEGLKSRIASLTKELNLLSSKAAAWDMIAPKTQLAQEYCSNIGARCGDNVWHAVLEDAIYLRIALLKLLRG